MPRDPRSGALRCGLRSLPGGLNVLMGDDSVRFLKDTIQTWPFNPLTGNPAGSSQNAQGAWVNLPPPRVWQALSTRSGGEATASAGY